MAESFGELTTVSYGSAVGDLLSVDFSGLKRGTVDCTVLGDTTVAVRMSALKDPGNVTLKAQYDATSHEFLVTALENGTSAVLSITLSDDSGQTVVWSCSEAYVSSIKLGNMTKDANVELDVEFVMSQWPTYGDSSGQSFTMSSRKWR